MKPTALENLLQTAHVYWIFFFFFNTPTQQGSVLDVQFLCARRRECTCVGVDCADMHACACMSVNVNVCMCVRALCLHTCLVQR